MSRTVEMFRRNRILILAIGGAAIVLTILWRLVAGPTVEGARVVKGAVVETLVVNGRVLARYRPEIGSAISGVVASVPVEEGDRVTEGETLVLLDGTELKSAEAEARSRLRQAEARLQLVGETTERENAEALERARAILREAEAEWTRQQKLAEEGLVAPSAVDAARRAVDVARSDVQAADARAKSTAVEGKEREVARAALDEARAALEVSRARLDRATITAPADGVVLSRLVAPGTAVQPGTPLLVMAFEDETLLLAQPDERALPKIHVGQEARASADAFSGESFDAEVMYVSPSIDLERGTFDVKLRAPDPPDYLRTDMTLSVEFLVGRKESALIIPASAVRDVAGQPWVLVVDGRARQIPVELGIRGEAIVEVVSGLEEGNVVMTDPGLRFVDRRVRARLGTGD
jgi:HlyD family secretion protein